jgi:hypothetical protein
MIALQNIFMYTRMIKGGQEACPKQDGSAGHITINNIFHKYLKEGTKWDIMDLLYRFKDLQVTERNQYYS